MNIAQKCRLEKEQHPERYCSKKNCLWKISKSGPCQNHPSPSPVVEIPMDEWDARGVSDAQLSADDADWDGYSSQWRRR